MVNLVCPAVISGRSAGSLSRASSFAGTILPVHYWNMANMERVHYIMAKLQYEINSFSV